MIDQPRGSNPNSIEEGVPFSTDLLPDGPDYDADDNPSGRVSQYDSTSLYADLPAVPTANHPAK